MHQRECACMVHQLGFALDDLALYLDTHPDCQAGLQMFESLQEQYQAAVVAYEAEIGPLRRSSGICNDYWQWADSPAPWEVCD